MKDRTFRNPLSATPAADPFVFFHGGYYYALCTEVFAVVIHRSRCLDNLFCDESKTVYTLGKEVEGHLWAPELHYIPTRNRWYIYTCGTRRGWDLNTMRMLCLESNENHPWSAYTCKGFTDPDHMGIDETVFAAPDGHLYTAYSRYEEPDHRSTQVITLALLEEPWKIASESAYPRIDLTRPEYDWEMQGWTPENHAHINEGPAFFWYKGHLSLVYSASACWSEDYCLGMVRYAGKDFTPAEMLNPANWRKSPTPIFRRANGVYGTGHNSFFTAADGTHWFAYHAMHTPDAGIENRYAYIQPLSVSEDGLPLLGEPFSRETDIPLPQEFTDIPSI